MPIIRLLQFEQVSYSFVVDGIAKIDSREEFTMLVCWRFPVICIA